MSKEKTVKSTLLTNIDKIAATAKSINSQLADTAEALREDAKNNGAQITDSATTVLKHLNITDSLKKVGNTAISVNSQVLETASEVIVDVYKTAKTSVEGIDLTVNVDKFKTVAQNVNDFAVKMADTVVEGALKNGEKWQGVAAKAVKGGLHLAGRQQDITFDNLEMVKDQLKQSASRFKNLFGKN